MNNGYEHALQYQLFLCAYPHGKRVMPLACERVITCRVRAFTLFPEIPWRVTNEEKINNTGLKIAVPCRMPLLHKKLPVIVF